MKTRKRSSVSGASACRYYYAVHNRIRKAFIHIVCIDALDECVAEQRAKILDSFDQILRRSPSTRIFVTGRPHIQVEIRNRHLGKVVIIHITPTRDDINNYLHTRLGEDTTPDAMDSTLKADILKKIPEGISEMCVDAMTPVELPPAVH